MGGCGEMRDSDSVTDAVTVAMVLVWIFLPVGAPQ